ncbi:ABC transporter ATP-binding protein [Arthrobacter sp. SLBN-53]|uniref:ABC transporter ATP-binding protein n=1 Tax=Arthrobacter sp. SLBN-53 TaxID=2768412 RepID=UPI00114DDAD6|nr:ABC transporter ATP-binding protein [Arthrobacter sp. SLBN-53]TQK30617.1 putative spermidine/putrescine transport system ATP-binding protein/spermidine/putrescine transport system ATP-binding protein [Arthrobacter sp. SLBN-53]
MTSPQTSRVATTTTVDPKPFIEIRDLHHEYSGITALDRVSLDIQPGEFVTLLGPSGSGKSSLLHILAGLVEATSGTLTVAGRDITGVPPQKREIGLVFQNYALFPHLTARENIHFPHNVRKTPAKEAAARVAEVLELVELTALADRRPDQLSGGQQQRVAVGRAISAVPKVLLLDEPLGALDRRLRQQLGHEIRRVQRETGITTLYVTHDQEEAFTMSDRVVVMNHGEIRQVGTPEEVYTRPRDAFVANFVGEVNLWPVQSPERTGDNATVNILGGADFTARCGYGPDVEALTLAVRPERVWVWHPGSTSPRPEIQFVDSGVIVESTFLGNSRSVVIESERLGRTSALLYDGEEPRDRGARVAFGWEAKHALIIPS